MKSFSQNVWKFKVNTSQVGFCPFVELFGDIRRDFWISANHAASYKIWRLNSRVKTIINEFVLLSVLETQMLHQFRQIFVLQRIAQELGQFFQRSCKISFAFFVEHEVHIVEVPVLPAVQNMFPIRCVRGCEKM